MESSEWDRKIREYGLNEWLRKNPGKTQADYEADWSESMARSKRNQEAAEQRAIENSAYLVAIFIYKCVRYVGIPALVAWALTWFLSIAFIPTFLAMIVILPILSMFRG